MTIINGNILESKADIIVHQVNTLGAMGAGLAKQIKDVYPTVFSAYQGFIKSFPTRDDLMGKNLMVKTKDGPIISNCFVKIGCGLAGGDWSVVLPMINRAANTYPYILYRYH